MRPPPNQKLAPRSRGDQAAPLQPPDSSTRGPEGHSGEPPPLPPPSPPPAHGQLEAGQGDGGPAPPPPGQGETPPPREGRDTQGGAPLPRYALLYAASPRSAVRPLPQYPRQAASPAPVRKGILRAASGQRHADVSQCSVGGKATTKRPALMPAQGGQRDGPRQSNLPAPRCTGPPGRAPDEGRRTNHPPPPRPD